MIYPNPLAKYNCELTYGLSKEALFRRDLKNGAYACCSDNSEIPLGNVRHADFVEFIGGLWRVQDYFLHKIQTIRDRDFVIGAPLDRHEQNMFEYYSAFSVSHNCYGPLIFGDPLVAACFNRGAEPLWAYGPTVEHARAFLAISLFDRNRDLIFNAEQAKRAAQR